MKISTTISVGELIDKLSILKIKEKKIKEKEKLKEVSREYDFLKKICQSKIPNYKRLVCEIEKVNLKLWDIEDQIRDKEKEKKFDSKFIKLARSVYKLNDKRFLIKDKINKKFGSIIKEQKSYC